MHTGAAGTLCVLCFLKKNNLCAFVSLCFIPFFANHFVAVFPDAMNLPGVMPNCFWKHLLKYDGLLKPTM